MGVFIIIILVLFYVYWTIRELRNYCLCKIMFYMKYISIMLYIIFNYIIYWNWSVTVGTLKNYSITTASDNIAVGAGQSGFDWKRQCRGLAGARQSTPASNWCYAWGQCGCDGAGSGNWASGRCHESPHWHHAGPVERP